MKTFPQWASLILCLDILLQASFGYASASASAVAESQDAEMARLNHNIATNPAYPFAYTVRGALKKSRGDLDGALADFNRAVSLDPKNAEAYNNLGLVKQAKRDLPGAAAEFSKAIALNPNYTDAWYNRGRVKKSAGDLDGALADYNRVLDLDPHYSDAWLRRGNLKMAKKDIPGAQSDFRMCYKFSDPHWKDYARINQWLARTARGEKTGANELISTYLTKRNPSTSSQNDWPAHIMEFLLNKIDETALITGATARGDQGQLCQAFYYAGMKQLLAGDKAKAAEFFNKCRATQKWDYDEYQFAISELKTLGM